MIIWKKYVKYAKVKAGTCSEVFSDLNIMIFVIICVQTCYVCERKS